MTAYTTAAGARHGSLGPFCVFNVTLGGPQDNVRRSYFAGPPIRFECRTISTENEFSE